MTLKLPCIKLCVYHLQLIFCKTAMEFIKEIIY